MTAQPRLAADGICIGYPGRPALLTNWDAEFWPGEVVAVTGPSGCGKSTLLYALGLMLKPRFGEVTVNGLATSTLGDSALSALRAHRYGFVFQDAALDSTRSILSNVLESSLYRNGNPSADASRAKMLLDRFGVSASPSRRPGQVSGGQAQRIALCRALLGNPPVLLADEPTGNLDDQSAQIVLNAFRAHADSGATVVVVTHDRHVVQAATREISL